MSHVLERTEITLKLLQETFSDQYEQSKIEDGTLFLTTEYGIEIMMEIDEEAGVIQWFCADKLKDDADELTISRLCKEYNDSGELLCCYINFNIDKSRGVYVGCSYELIYEYDLILKQLIATHTAFSNSMVNCFAKIQDLGYFPERTEK